MKKLRSLALIALFACGAQHVKVEPVKIEPIHMTIDVNLHDDAAQKKQPGSQ